MTSTRRSSPRCMDGADSPRVGLFYCMNNTLKHANGAKPCCMKNVFTAKTLPLSGRLYLVPGSITVD